MEFGKEIKITEDGSLWCKPVGLTSDQVITGDRGCIYQFTAIGHHHPGQGNVSTPDHIPMTWSESRGFIISGISEDDAINNFIKALFDRDSYVNTHWTMAVVGIDLRPAGSPTMLVEDNVGA